MQYELKISNYKALVFLGNNEEEQREKRRVFINISILFDNPPAACFTDQLQDTVCYEDLCIAINKALGDRRFKLIENLAQVAFDIVKAKVSGQISVEVIKDYPLNYIESASFKIVERMTSI